MSCGKVFASIVALAAVIAIAVVIYLSMDDGDDAPPATGNPTASECVGSGGLLTADGQACLRSPGNPRSWDQAELECSSSYKGNLASVHSQAEYIEVLALALPSETQRTGVWIGLNDRASENVLVYSDGSIVDYFNWTTPLLNATENEPRDCVSVQASDRYMTNSTCAAQYAYICRTLLAKKPSQPPSPSAVVPNDKNNAIRVTIAPPSSDGGAPITGYTIRSHPAHVQDVVVSGIGSHDVTGLTIGQAYTFSVAATNKAGTSVFSNASNSVIPIAIEPGAPTDVSAVAGNTEASVSFKAPAFTGGDGVQITGYTVTSSPGSLTRFTTTTFTTFTSLTNGVAYSFTVTAQNHQRTGPASPPSNAVTPTNPRPLAPADILVSKPFPQMLRVGFSEPSANTYTAIAYESGVEASRNTSTSSPIDLWWLSSTKSYQITVHATNGAGDGAASLPTNATSPTPTVPEAPSNVGASLSGGSVSVTFSPVGVSSSCFCRGEGGAPVTSYLAQGVPTTPGQVINGTCTVSPCSVGGGVNGVTYYFVVRAINSAGVGPASTQSNTIILPTTVPGTPTFVAVKAGNANASLSWSEPTNGGDPIKNYTVTSSPATVVHVLPASSVCSGSCSFVFPSLAIGTSYTFALRATNDVGSSATSDASVSVTPFAVSPFPVNSAVAVGGPQKVTINIVPAYDGGSSILKYRAISSPGSINLVSSVGQITFEALPSSSPRLTLGVSYTFAVTVETAVGTSPVVTTNSAVAVATIPDAATNVRGVAGAGVVAVSWDPPANDGGSPILYYTVLSSPHLGLNWSTSDNSTSLFATQLTLDATYQFLVVAVNAIGRSLDSPLSLPVTLVSKTDDSESSGGTLSDSEKVITASVSIFVALAVGIVIGYCWAHGLHCFKGRKRSRHELNDVDDSPKLKESSSQSGGGGGGHFVEMPVRSSVGKDAGDVLSKPTRSALPTSTDDIDFVDSDAEGNDPVVAGTTSTGYGGSGGWA